MNEADALDLIQRTVWTIIIGSSPAVLAAMIVGLVISLLQALTQIQEMTLTFVPKILTIFLAIILGATFMGAQIASLAQMTFSHIESGF